jgi:thiol-disulfide isomerase/thioredoxin
MPSSRTIALAAAILVVAWEWFAYRPIPSDPSVEQAAAELMRLSLPDTAGKSQNLGQWRDKILVVNFWATWCEPCRQEIPALLRFEAKNVSNGIQIVGISVDSVAKVREFADEYKIGYPLLMAGMDVVELTRRLGNKVAGLPYTVVMDRSGRVVKTHLGGISEAELEDAARLAGT